MKYIEQLSVYSHPRRQLGQHGTWNMNCWWQGSNWLFQYFPVPPLDGTVNQGDAARKDWGLEGD